MHILLLWMIGPCMKNVMMAADYRPGGITPERGCVGIVWIKLTTWLEGWKALRQVFSCPVYCIIHLFGLSVKLYIIYIFYFKLIITGRHCGINQMFKKMQIMIRKPFLKSYFEFLSFASCIWISVIMYLKRNFSTTISV